MTIIEREKWRCADCGAEDYYYELMSTNDFWGDPEDTSDCGPPKTCPSCDSEHIQYNRRVFVRISKAGS